MGTGRVVQGRSGSTAEIRATGGWRFAGASEYPLVEAVENAENTSYLRLVEFGDAVHPTSGSSEGDEALTHESQTNSHPIPAESRSFGTGGQGGDAPLRQAREHHHGR